MRRIQRVLSRSLGAQRGSSLLEVVMAIAIMGVVAVAGLAALSTVARATQVLDSEAVAQNLALTQMEYLKSLPYEPLVGGTATYATITPPVGYSLSAVAEGISGRGPEMQKVVVTVFRSGRELTAIEGYKNEQ